MNPDYFLWKYFVFAFLCNFSKHQVPTLQLDSGDVLTESIVIAKYLCKLNPDCEIYSGD